MYDVRQFRSVLYAVLCLGLTGFALAARAPGLWVVSMAALWGHALLRRRGSMRPLPTWAAAGIALAFLVGTVRTFLRDPGNQLLAAGEFLAALQLVKLYQEGSYGGVKARGEGRGDGRGENRNYAWLLVLSFLLMVSAMISTASLAFGVLLLAYLLLSLYACQLFHLKVEAEAARAAMTLPKDVPHPAILRQDERYLSSSMRRLTVLISAAGLGCAVVVFVFFPRGPGAGLLGQLNFKPQAALTGFSESVSFESVARIQQSQQRVAYVGLSRGGKPVGAAAGFYWRGLTLDAYSGDGSEVMGPDDAPHTVPPWQWTRSQQEATEARSGGAGERVSLARASESMLEQTVRLEPTGIGVLFAAPGACAVTFSRDARFRFAPSDETLGLMDAVNVPVEYTVWSRGDVGYSPSQDGDPMKPRKRSTSKIDARVREFARRPEVSGVTVEGRPMWSARGAGGARTAVADPLDARIAENIERYLKANYSYTLDLTDTTRRSGEDPLVQFLYETRRGHCEYFAGAMALMCQSLGLEARMVTGFKVSGDSYNALTGQWTVRESDAHAWVEVLVGPGEHWETYDPTSGREAASAGGRGWGASVRRVMDYLEYTWADSVVAYDRDRRDNLLQNVEKGLTAAAAQTSKGVSGWGDWLPDVSDWGVSPKLVVGTIIVMVLIAVGAVARFAWERWMMRRRAARIGLDALPGGDRIRLARQLGFYDDLLRMLEARGYRREKHLTPVEFARTLTHLPTEAYDAVRRLTRIYYRIRYGQAKLSPAYQQRVGRSLARLEPALGTRTQGS
jgi:transglutaminase-like putative cysteine protease